MRCARFKTLRYVLGAVLVLGPAAVPVRSELQGDQPAAPAELPGHRRMAMRIDELLAAEWKTVGVEPARPASDAEFLRRASLDLTGVIPRTSQVRAFLADDHADKRALLVEQLLASPRYATHMASTWHNRILPLGVDPSRAREAAGLQKWLRARFAKNLRYDNLVGGLLLASGGEELGPALYFQSHELAPEKVAASAAELFLGVQLHCAQCHDHPYADWSQRDFWGLAAFFARVRSPGSRGMMQASYRLEDADSGDVMLPESTEIVPPKFPRGDALADDGRQSRRLQLVAWMASRDNPFFARAAVNWAWTHLFGRGLVESLDEADADSPGPNAELLDELAQHFVDSGFDLQQLWRTLASTRAYQLSTRHEHPQLARPALFARMLPKPLTPEQLYDSFVLLSPTKRAASEGGARPVDVGASLDGDPTRAAFIRQMRSPPGRPTDYRAGTLQVLELMNGQATAGVTAPAGSSLLGALEAPFMSDEDRIQSLFLATLSRPPDAEERAACAAALAEGETPQDRRRALSDLLWALVNSTEFAFNH